MPKYYFKNKKRFLDIYPKNGPKQQLDLSDNDLLENFNAKCATGYLTLTKQDYQRLMASCKCEYFTEFAADIL